MRRILVGVGGVGAAAAREYGAGERHVVQVERLGELETVLRDGEVASAFVFVRDTEFDLASSRRLVALAGELGVPVGVAPVPPERTAAIRWTGRLRTRRHSTKTAPRRVLCFRDGEDAAGFVREAAEGVAAIVLETHSNGADHRLGDRVLCVQADVLAPAPANPGERCLPCQAGGGCLREARRPRGFVGAASLRADLIVMLSCSGFMPSDGVISPRFTLASALLDGGHAIAVVASWMVHSVPAGLVGAAVAAVRSGTTAGELALSLNEHVATPSYLCLGDPELALLCEVEPAMRRVLVEAPAAQPAAPSLEAALIAQLAGPDPSPPVRHVAQSLTASLERPGSGLALAGFLAEHVARGSFLYKEWAPELPLGNEQPSSELHRTCGSPMVRCDAASPRWPGCERTVWICHRCGYVGDGPRRCRLLELTWNGQRLAVDLSPLALDGPAWLAWAVEPVGVLVEPTMPTVAIDIGHRRGAIDLAAATTHPHRGMRWLAAVVTWPGNFAVARVCHPGVTP